MFTTLQCEYFSIQDVETCNLTRSLLLQVDESLTEPRPLLSLEVPGTFRSMAYSRHLNTWTHYLFLGANRGRLFQVGLSMLFHTGLLDQLLL